MIYYPGASTILSFAGKMNNGLFTTLTSYTDTAKGFNLVPNPYPSAIDWRSPNNVGWIKTNVDSAIYIWNSGTSTSQYASYVKGVSVNGGSRYIAPGQSFFVHANLSSPVVRMDNDVRVHYTAAFMKDQEFIPNCLHLKVNANQANDEIAVRFTEGATSGFDGAWDAYKLQGMVDAPQLSTVSSDNNDLCINSLPIVGGNITVPLNFSFSSSIDVTFSACGIETFKSNAPIYLEDKTDNKLVNLRLNPVYTFSYQTNNPIDRFQLHFSGINGISNLTSKDGKVYFNNGRLYIDSPGMEGNTADISIYNLLGQLVRSEHSVINGIVSIEAPESPGVFIISVSSAEQHFVSKVIIK